MQTVSRPMPIVLIVGSEMGNAEMVADLVKAELESSRFEPEQLSSGGLEALRPAERSLALVITSTTGLGDVPQNIEPLYAELAEQRPDLSHLRYGVVGLGDRNYKDTFCGGPKKWDALLTELGAQRVGEPLLLDATDNPMPDQDAIAWLPGWIEQL
jgi:MioC protein